LLDGHTIGSTRRPHGIDWATSSSLTTWAKDWKLVELDSSARMFQSSANQAVGQAPAGQFVPVPADGELPDDWFARLASRWERLHELSLGLDRDQQVGHLLRRPERRWATDGNANRTVALGPSLPPCECERPRSTASDLR
jgi:hypothetical protein